MRVLDVEDQRDIGERLCLVAAVDIMQHEDIDRREIRHAGSRHAPDHPAAERVVQHDHSEFDLGERRQCAARQVPGGYDRAEFTLFRCHDFSSRDERAAGGYLRRPSNHIFL
jgi:hypothetical protein